MRLFVTDHMPVKKDDPRFPELWSSAEYVDLLLDEAYQQGGVPAVEAVLDTNDVVEHCMSRLAAEVSYGLSGDRIM